MTTSEELTALINKSLTGFKDITEQQWNYKAAPGKWSKKEILGHLIDSAMTNLRRFIFTQFEQNRNIIYLQDEWVTVQDYQNRKTEDIIQLWQSINFHIAHTIAIIPVSKMNNTCDTGKGKPELHTLEFLTTDYVIHMKHHLDELFKH
jgi:DinB family protein